MIKYFTKAFKLTNENILLTTPLLLFLLLFFTYLGFAKSTANNIPSQILLITTILFMFSAFFAGWLFMVKKAVDLDKVEFNIEEDKAKATLGLFKKIPIGIGEYFFSYLGAIILYTILLGLLYFSIFKIGLHYIGNIGLSIKDLNLAFTTPAALQKTLSSMTTDQLTKFSYWLILFFTSIMTFYFLTMFWFVQIVFKVKNPLIALFKSLKVLFKNFFESIILFIYISLINFLVTVVSNILVINSITQFISMLISFYFVVYVVVLIFLYYDHITNRKIKIKNGITIGYSENNVSHNSDSRPDSIRQEPSGDSDSKES